MNTLYGIKNCDTIKRACAWLKEQGVSYEFFDLRSSHLDKHQVTAWMEELGLETLINKRSATWKNLDNADQQELNTTDAVNLIVAYPTLIKRPLLDTGVKRYVGFSDAQYAEIFR